MADVGELEQKALLQEIKDIDSEIEQLQKADAAAAAKATRNGDSAADEIEAIYRKSGPKLTLLQKARDRVNRALARSIKSHGDLTGTDRF